MSSETSSVWSIDKIICGGWSKQNDTADIYISNYEGDSIEFQVVRTPDGDPMPFNVVSDFRSPDWYLHTSETDAVESVLLEIDKLLNHWGNEISRTIPFVKPSEWKVKRGLPVKDTTWASLAYLYELRASMYERKIIEALARELNCDVATMKERIKNLRRIGFLTAPGQGARGEGKATIKAKKILEREGILNAKKSK